MNNIVDSLFDKSDYNDDRVIKYVYPKKVLWSENIENPERILEIKDAQTIITSGENCLIFKRGSSILLDFGREMQGGIQIYTSIWNQEHPKYANVRVRFGESAMECMSDATDLDSSATNEHAVRDSEYRISWLGMTEIGNTGFRFVRIDMLSDLCIPVWSIRAKFQYRDMPLLGTFECDDERINKIWQTAVYTVLLNMQEYVWDGIKRDRLVWIGDMHPETSTIQYVFGKQKCVEKSLDLIRDTTPLPGIMNGITAYSMWWLLIHHDYFMHFGDIDYLARQHEYMARLIRFLGEYIADDGSITIENCFLDWPSSTNPDGQRAGVHALFTMVCDGCVDMFQALGDKESAEYSAECSNKLKKYSYTHNNLKQALALQVLSGLKNSSEAFDELLCKDGAHGFSTFLGYYILNAMAKSGNHEFALKCMKEYWGGMLDLGATTFWEDFDLNWTKNCSKIDEILPPESEKDDIHGDFGGYCYKGYRHSFCHGWASGPAPFLMEYILGIKPIQPGFKQVSIKPNLAGLKYVHGTVPTPYGIIEVKVTHNADGTQKVDYKVPCGVEVIK